MGVPQEVSTNLADESHFRLAFGAFWLISFLIRTYFQARAGRSQRSFVRDEKAAKRGFRFLAIAYLLLILYPLSTITDFASVPIPSILRWIIGGLLLFLYLLIFTWAHVALGRHWSGLLEIHTDHILVTSGPYRYVRHPMYSAFLLSGIGFFFLSANWIVGLIYLSAMAFMYFTRVSAEEEMMIEHFGEVYKLYMARTGRLFPRIVLLTQPVSMRK